jgi:YD repeat-containing protein
MRKAVKTLPFFLVLLGIAILPLHAHSVLTATQSQDTPSQVAPSQAPQERTELIARGQLINLDPDNRTVTIRQADDTEMQFAYDENTTLVGTQDGVQGLSNGQPTTVAVHYTQDTQSGQSTATIIEILP